MKELPKFVYTSPPHSGEPLDVKSSLYPCIRRVQQAIGELVATQIQSNGNPYNTEAEGLMTVIPLPGSTMDLNTEMPLGGDLIGIFYHLSMFKTLMANDSLGYESLLDEFVSCKRPGTMKSPGKSPTFFIFGESGQYLIKQLKNKELTLMLKICASYGRHLLANPSSLLIRIYGMFSITSNRGVSNSSTLPHKFGKDDKHFVIMPNLFSTPIRVCERYDLKGSWVGRYTSLQTEGDRFTRTLKDINMETYIYLTTLRRRILIHQLKADTDWLKKHNLVDYSLLLGVTGDIPCISPERKKHKSVFSLHSSSTGPETPNTPSTPVCFTQPAVRGEDSPVSPNAPCVDADTPLQRFYDRLLAAKSPRTIVSARDISYMFPPLGYRITQGPNRKTSLSLASLSPDEYIAEVYRKRLTFETALQANNIFHSEEGGFYAFSPHCTLGSTIESSVLYYRVIYMGVIDFLTEFKSFKHIERRLKGLCNDKNGISAIPSESYANRFMRFCRVIFQVPIPSDGGLQCEDCSEITIYEESD